MSTLNTPTYINSATSISEPIKSFDGLDHNYTPEEYLQHIEARVTFSLGLQPPTAHEYKFWHARRMAFIQCSLTGTALSWYFRLNNTYKQDWHAFVQAFKKQFSSQKNAYYAQVEAFSSIKKDNETVRHFALRVQQLVEKGWCNENASTINLKCNEIFTKGLPKNLKDFANKRQVKHTSTILEPSIPFHTLVKLVDAEDIANDKIRTHDLTLEVNNITKQLQTQSLHSQQSDQVMDTQPRDPNNKTKPAYKNTAPIAIEQIILSLLVSKNNEMMKINAILMQDQNPLKNHLYNISVPPPMIKHKDMIQDQLNTPHDTVVEVRPVMTTKDIIDNDLLQERAIITIELPLLHITFDLVMTTIAEILVDIVHHIDPPTNHLIDVIHVPVTNVDHTQEITTFQDTLLLIDYCLDLEILDILDLAPILRHETKSITFNHKLLLTQPTLKYTCTTQQKWQMHKLLQAGFTLYTHIHPQIKTIVITLQDLKFPSFLIVALQFL